MLANIERRDGNIKMAETLLGREISQPKRASLRVIDCDFRGTTGGNPTIKRSIRRRFNDPDAAKKIFMSEARRINSTTPGRIALNAPADFCAIQPETGRTT